MDLAKVLAQLRTELENLDAAILSLEQIQQVGGHRRRGRPPKALAALHESARAARRRQAAAPSSEPGEPSE